MARREEEEPEELDSYIGKRAFAYIVDIILTAIGPVILAIGLVMGGEYALEMPIYVGIIVGVVSFLVLHYLYFVICEGMGRCTPGTRMVGLEVALENPPVDDEGEAKDIPIGGKALVRNAPKLGALVGAAITLKNPALGCYFREFTPDEVIEMKPKRAWTPKEKGVCRVDVAKMSMPRPIDRAIVNPGFSSASLT